ncbi:protein FAR1-RELATED SEQUENCE 5 isoform X1 [Triticum aestivum]|uniref:protein FAR1-RELATED SEQUENCE 5 isoform X1 n=1 Tax=Triticum aestivum TaxID=4565 RepID=UPI001D016310|nr:protein FAR1-RELATED SEQUENCE 5-like isoform X1 [Triticum aestivum]
MAPPDDSSEALDHGTYTATPPSEHPLHTAPIMPNDGTEAPDRGTYTTSPGPEPALPTAPPPVPCSNRQGTQFRQGRAAHQGTIKICKTKIIFVGMSFQSEEEAYQFYNSYAKIKEFSIRKCHLKLRAHNTVSARYLVCSKAGVKATHPTHVPKKEQAISTTDCMARVQFSINPEGVWSVQKVILEHNHQLVSPDKRHMLRSQRQLLDADRHMIKQMRTSGIKQAEIYDFCELWYGKDAMSFLQMDCNNYLRSERSKYLETKDAQTLTEYPKISKLRTLHFSMPCN